MKSSNIPNLTAIQLPFAFYGETNVASPKLDPFTDPAEEADGKNFFDSRWAWNSSTNPATPPSRVITRQLMNRLFAQISGRQFLKQCGALDTFDQHVCDSIGGYPQGAVLQYLDGNILYDVVSMRDNNDTDYTKIGVDGINWRIYGSSVFSYVYPDYGSVGQNNILKIWEMNNLGVWNYQFFDSSYGNIYFVSDLKLVDVEGTQRWQITLNYIGDPDKVFGSNIDPSATASSVHLQFGWSDFYVQAHRYGAQVSSDDLTITSPCWIEAFITEPKVSEGLTNYECGIILYGGKTHAPSVIPAFDNAFYTVRELTEGGTISTEVIPVLPGDKITAFANKNGAYPCDIVIRKLTPTRTR